jgi:hypothetical protein
MDQAARNHPKVKLPKTKPKLKAIKKTKARLYHRSPYLYLNLIYLLKPTVIFLDRFYASDIQLRERNEIPSSKLACDFLPI